MNCEYVKMWHSVVNLTKRSQDRMYNNNKDSDDVFTYSVQFDTGQRASDPLLPEC